MSFIICIIAQCVSFTTNMFYRLFTFGECVNFVASCCEDLHIINDYEEVVNLGDLEMESNVFIINHMNRLV
jgi:hypothetical protein